MKTKVSWRVKNKKKPMVRAGPVSTKSPSHEQASDELSQEVQGNLTPKELTQLKEIKRQLANLHLPKPAHDAFALYKTDQVLASQRSLPMALVQQLWRDESEEAKTYYEEKASLLFQEYQSEFDRVQTLSDKLWAEEKEIKAKGNMVERISFKRVSPYRVYKRETAASIKTEFPLMSNEERSQIVKERWHTIADKQKAVYVALARLEEE